MGLWTPGEPPPAEALYRCVPAREAAAWRGPLQGACEPAPAGEAEPGTAGVLGQPCLVLLDARLGLPTLGQGGRRPSRHPRPAEEGALLRDSVVTETDGAPALGPKLGVRLSPLGSTSRGAPTPHD